MSSQNAWIFVVAVVIIGATGDGRSGVIVVNIKRVSMNRDAARKRKQKDCTIRAPAKTFATMQLFI